MPICPSCKSKNLVKNGFTHNGNQNHNRKVCGRQFVDFYSGRSRFLLRASQQNPSPQPCLVLAFVSKAEQPFRLV
jgi:transposase-like protein